jgi:predicted nuclease with TOPRIM domain
VEQLRKRLEASQAENEQLEEMLKREESRADREAEAAQRLAAELSELQASSSSPWVFSHLEPSSISLPGSPLA